MKFIRVLFFLTFLSGILFLPSAFAENVPDWVKNTAGWWATDAISETEFVNAIEFLVKENIIQVNVSQTSETSESVPKNYEVPQNRVFGLQNCNNLAPWARNFNLPRTKSRALTPKIGPNKNPIVFLATFRCFLIDCCTIWRPSIAHVKVECITRNCLKTECKNLVTCYTPS